MPAAEVGLLDEALRLYRERFVATGMFENSVYPDVPEGLTHLTSMRGRFCGTSPCPTTSKERTVRSYPANIRTRPASFDSCWLTTRSRVRTRAWLVTARRMLWGPGRMASERSVCYGAMVQLRSWRKLEPTFWQVRWQRFGKGSAASQALAADEGAAAVGTKATTEAAPSRLRRERYAYSRTTKRRRPAALTPRARISERCQSIGLAFSTPLWYISGYEPRSRRTRHDDCPHDPVSLRAARQACRRRRSMWAEL